MIAANGTENSVVRQRKPLICYAKGALLILPTVSISLAVEKYDRMWVKETIEAPTVREEQYALLFRAVDNFGACSLRGFNKLSKVDELRCTDVHLRLNATR
jgi:hypothetical protein